MRDGFMTLPVDRSSPLLAPALCWCLFSCLGFLACGLSDSTPPVATAAVGLNRTRVALGGPVQMTYQFTRSADAPLFDEDYRVFVHFLDADGEMMFSDDHDPPVPTTSWEPGQRITYDRRLIVPIYPYIGEATIAVGLYSPTSGERLSLAAEQLGQRAYRVAAIEMTPQSESGLLVFEDGWYGPESIPGQLDREWRWSGGHATISFRNPRVDSTLHLEVDGRPELLERPQVLTLSIEETVLETIELASEAPAYHVVPLSAGVLGEADTVRLTLDVDPTFVPAVVTNGENADGRELGAAVFYAFIESN